MEKNEWSDDCIFTTTPQNYPIKPINTNLLI